MGEEMKATIEALRYMSLVNEARRRRGLRPLRNVLPLDEYGPAIAQLEKELAECPSRRPSPEQESDGA